MFILLLFSVEYLVQKNVFRNIGVCCDINRHLWAPRCCTNVMANAEICVAFWSIWCAAQMFNSNSVYCFVRNLYRLFGHHVQYVFISIVRTSRPIRIYIDCSDITSNTYLYRLFGHHVQYVFKLRRPTRHNSKSKCVYCFCTNTLITTAPPPLGSVPFRSLNIGPPSNWFENQQIEM
jgi:hypothetical protein